MDSTLLASHASRIVTHLVDVVYVLRTSVRDPFHGRVLFVSDQIRTLLGYDPQDFVNDSTLWARNVHPDDLPALAAQTSMIYASGDAAVRRYRLRHRTTGEYHLIEDHVQPLPADGDAMDVVGVARDVTHVTRLTSSLHQAHTRYQHLLETSPFGILVVDAGGMISIANREAEALLGYASGALLGRSVEELLPEAVRAAHKQHRATFGAAPRPRPMGSGRYLYARRTDGREIPVEVSLIPIEGPTGERLVRCTIRDLSERLAAEQALEQSEARYRALFERSVVGHFVARKDGQVVACNTAWAQLAGYPSVAEAIGTNCLALAAVDEQREACLDALRRTGRVEHVPMVLRRLDGTLRHVIFSATSERGHSDGDPIEIHGEIFDDTARVTAEAQLRQAQKLEAVGALAGGIAHDFNNLLTVILGCGEAVKLGAAAVPGVHDDLDEILKAATRAASLTRQLLAFSRRSTVVLVPVALNTVVSVMRSMLQRLLGERIRVVIELQLSLPIVRADVQSLEHVLVNLAVNARDAMPDGGCLTIETQARTLDEAFVAAHPGAAAGAYACLVVRDEGEGMPPEVLERIFEPFFTTKAVGHGTGLGLASVYGTVKQFGGYIDVRSTVGRGAEFAVYLPAADSAAQVTALPEPSRAPEPVDGTVLVVEDDDNVRATIAATLSRHGYQVHVAASAEDAGAMIDHLPELAILIADVVLPTGTGTDLSEHVRRRHPSAAVLLMSGYPRNADSALLDLSGVPFIEKPFTGGALLKAVESLRRERS